MFFYSNAIVSFDEKNWILQTFERQQIPNKDQSVPGKHVSLKWFICVVFRFCFIGTYRCAPNYISTSYIAVAFFASALVPTDIVYRIY